MHDIDEFLNSPAKQQVNAKAPSPPSQFLRKGAKNKHRSTCVHACIQIEGGVRTQI